MKLTTALILLLCMHVSASVSSQTISFTGKEVAIEKVFEAIEKQTGFSIAANASLVRACKPVTIEAKNEPLEKFLERLLAGEGLQFSIRNKTIVISRKPVLYSEELTLIGSPSGPPAPSAIQGKVTDAKGAPLAGVSILIRGTSKGTSTAADGNFSIRAEAGDILMISSIGFLQQMIKLNADHIAGTLPLIIRLAASESKLDEMVVMAYGSTTRRFSVSNSGSIKANDIANQPVSNPMLALQGRIPGLQITQSTGLNNGGVKVTIQGTSVIDLNTKNDPLIVIDGIPYASNLMFNWGNILGYSGTETRAGSSGSPLSFINPMDIERIDVLKDADATAIYGSRAAHGAILITTKKGKSGKMVVDVNMRAGISFFSSQAKLLNTKQYLEVRKEAFSNFGLTPSADPSSSEYAVDLMVWDTTRYTNWQKELLGKPVSYMSSQVSISGGNNNINYRVSATYDQQNSPFKSAYGYDNDKKIATLIALNSTSDNKRFRTGVSIMYMYDMNRLPNSDPTNQAVNLSPNAPALYNADGSLNWGLNKAGAATFYNPLAGRYTMYSNNTANLVSNFEMGYDLVKGLTLSGRIGFNNLQSDDYMFNSSLSAYPERRKSLVLLAYKGNYNIRNLVLEPLLTYKGNLWKGTVEAMAGFNYQRENRVGTNIRGDGFKDDQSLWDMSQAKTTSLITNVNEYRYNAGFGKLNYLLLNTYMLNLAIRRDASSRFGPENRYHDFWSAGAG
ncbi:MAG: SusC/RagA family TonB-linked outer membrane protein [Chitinophagaceae bacterium]|nr:SusC/RagA family TonB-linked outer membrane protein [Chitinophagaceae bacterium]